MSNIYIPPKINVGFQNRQDTYTGKLAYVVYFDDKGKLHKEPSWNGWRNKDIPNEIYENEPLEGFVLNKKAGGDNYGWNHRNTYSRVYDPRGFEFEITIENLLWILECSNCIKGKGLEGKYIYGWDGKDLVLVPTESPDYQTIVDKNTIRQNNNFIKGKDLIVGATYKTLTDKLYVYLGRYKYYDTTHSTVPREDFNCAIDNLTILRQDFKIVDAYYMYKDCGYQYYFAELENNRLDMGRWGSYVSHWRSLPKKFIECVDSTCHPDYKVFFENKVENQDFFSPIDVTKNKIVPLTYDQFHNDISIWIATSSSKYWGKQFFFCKDGVFDSETIYYDNQIASLYVSNRGRSYNKTSYCSIKTIFDVFKPCCGIQYLMNGKEYKRIGIGNE